MEQPSAVVDPQSEAPLGASTVCGAFQRTVALHGDQPALGTLDGDVALTWAQVGERVRRIAGGLASLGIGHGDTVAMLLPNTVECHLVDFAAVHVGAVPFTIYNSSSPEQIAHQLDNADARVVVTQPDFAEKVAAARELTGVVDHVLLSADELEAREAPADFDFDAAWRAVDAEDLVTLIFTSGTTGPPKGAQVAHRTVIAQLRSLAAVLPMPSEGIISFLPMAHAGGRLTSHYMALVHGAPITVCPDMKQLPVYLAKVRPDVLFAVPRLWEKLQVGIEALLDGAPADAASARPVLARMGLDRIKVGFVGGAPSAPELSEFFRGVGVPLLEAYGLTEGSLNIFNRIEEFKGGTAGRPLPGVEINLADDGELLIRSDLVFSGYRKQPEQTAATIVDGWLQTGDIAEVDEDGYVTIVDRKKEIIINAAGKNMSPANIEQAIKGESSLIGQVVCIGDGRRYNTALITLDPEAAPRYGDGIGAEIERAVAAGNARLSTVEQIKKYTLLETAWLPDSDELTPTAKVKRKPIAAKYADTIEAMYDN
jgi:long-subunit acyl-CoA synthetase (AMP-forming)